MTERLLMYPCTVGLPRYSPRSQSSGRRLAPSTIPKFWARGLATDPSRVVTRARPARHVLVRAICFLLSFPVTGSICPTGTLVKRAGEAAPHSESQLTYRLLSGPPRQRPAPVRSVVQGAWIRAAW